MGTVPKKIACAEQCQSGVNSDCDGDRIFAKYKS